MAFDPSLPVLARYERVAGAKETYRALVSDAAEKVYVAKDAEPRVVRDLIEMCRKKNVQIVYVESMKLLGELCRLRVGAAACAVLRKAGKH